MRRKKNEEIIPAARGQRVDLVAQRARLANRKAEEEAKFGRSHPEAKEGDGDYFPAYPLLCASI